MNVYIVTDSSSYDPRAGIAAGFYAHKGHTVTCVLSDFDHRKKKKRGISEIGVQGAAEGVMMKLSEAENVSEGSCSAPDKDSLNKKCAFAPDKDGLSFKIIETVPYQKNISVKRLRYHAGFAKKAYSYLREEKIDLLYVLLPANSLAPMAVKLKEEQGCRLIFDLIDLWPESMPIGGISWTPPYKHWQKLRDDNINKADCIITECELYKSLLPLEPSKTVTMYWPKAAGSGQRAMNQVPKNAGKTQEKEYKGPENGKAKVPQNVWECSEQKADELTYGEQQYIDNKNDKDESGSGIIRTAYLGSINNIIDIPEIIRILTAIEPMRNVTLDIIGDGERRGDFLDALTAAGIEYTYHGAIYDEEKKQEILGRCEWGLNIMKPGVKVGLTMKSIDYMSAGLRLINNIPGDTWELVEKEHTGVNVGSESVCKRNSTNGASKAAAGSASGAERKAAEAIACFEGAPPKRIRAIFRERFSTEAQIRKYYDAFL